VDERGREGEKEEEAEENPDGGDDFGVNEALFGPGGLVLGCVQVFTCEAGDGGAEGQLADAEAEGEGVGEDHVGGWVGALDGMFSWRRDGSD